MNKRVLEIIINAVDNASKTLKDVTGSTSKMESAMVKAGGVVNKVLSSAFKVAAVAGAGLIAIGYKSVEAFGKQELAVARLERGIQNVKSATDKNIQSLLDQASALQRVTRFGDEQIISAQGILSTFQLNQKAIEKLTPRLLDMAEGIAKVDGGMPDLENSAMMVAKALGGEDIAGLSGALRRVGVIMTETQEETLRTGDMQERLAIITEILDGNFQGLAESAGDTLPGQIAKMKNAVGDLMEKIGEALSHALIPFIEKITEWAQSEYVQEQLDDYIAKFKEWSEKSLKPFMENELPNLASKTSDTFKQIGDVITWVTEHWDSSLKYIASAMGIVVLAISAAAGSIVGAGALIVSVIVAVIKVFVELYHYFGDIWDVTVLRWEGNIMRMKLQWENLKKAFSVGFLEGIKEVFRQAIDNIYNTVAKGVNNIVGKLNSIPGVNIGEMTERGEVARQSGGEVIAGRPYMVGEVGREKFVPRETGRIIPNNELNDGITINMTNNIIRDTDPMAIARQIGFELLTR